jgi:putative PIN family toxin of toxin-antitoxin system
VILFVAEQPDFEWIASAEIVEEYVAVLRRDKFGLPEALIRQWTEIFNSLITVVQVEVTVNFPRDQKDAKFLACALETNADYFITGDRDFVEAYKLVNTIVLSVSLFKKLVCDVW